MCHSMIVGYTIFLSIFQICDLSHIRQPHRGSVDVNIGIFLLLTEGGGDGAIQLSPDAFRPEQAEVFNGVNAQVEVLIENDNLGVG